MANLTQLPPPVGSGVDAGAAKVSWPWLQWFQNLVSNLKALLGTLGAQYLNAPYGMFQSNVSQTLTTANTPTRVALEVTDYANGVYAVVGNGIHFPQAGLYNLTYSIQFANTDNQIHNAVVWFRQNGVDVAGSASKFDIIAHHGSADGYVIGASVFPVKAAADDYVELWWACDSTTVYLEAYTAQTSPYARPSIPSVVATVQFVSNV